MQKNHEGAMDPGVEKPAKKAKNELLEWLKALLIALVLVVLIRWLLFKPFIVQGPSMEPNFVSNQKLIVNEILYDFRKPERGKSLCSMYRTKAGISLSVSSPLQETL